MRTAEQSGLETAIRPGQIVMPAAALLISLLVLAPCFWQQRIQAGDLSSHLYNGWLALLIERGQAPGLRWRNNRTTFSLI